MCHYVRFLTESNTSLGVLTAIWCTSTS